MVVGLHIGRPWKYADSEQVYEQILRYNKIDYIKLNLNDIDFWEQVEQLDYFIYRFYVATDLKEQANAILPVIENYYGIKCFPNQATCWMYDDKIKEYYLLKKHGFPVIETHIFWDEETALNWIETALFPLVFKLKSGSRSQNVILVKDKQQARLLVKKMFDKGIDPDKSSFFMKNRLRGQGYKEFLWDQALRGYRFIRGVDISPYWEIHKNYVLFQEYQPNNLYDTRVTVIGDRAYALIRYNRRQDFRASGSGKYNLDRSKIDKRCLDIAFKISDTLGFQSMAYDFLFNINGDPIISEISYTYPCIDQYEEPGYFDRDFNHHAGHFWAEYFHLIDLLGLPDLKQPDHIKLARKGIKKWKLKYLNKKKQGYTVV
ncbi:MAG TPA: hypothetical protein ENK25_07070 [Bacteroidetes bacterium]|nr:hypothetical protein [Bacteroidota bacterium]